MALSVKESEEKVLKFWKEKKIYEKLKNKLKNKKVYYFLDGPPYATGFIHIGTSFNKILKDCYLRFLRMRGFNVWDQPGYDCHGVPIEHKVEENLGFKTKKDIENFSIENFIGECKKFATQFIDVMSEQFRNLGIWMDWKNPYLTLTNEYIEGAWFTFKKAFEKGLLRKGKYPVHVCPRCVDLNSEILMRDCIKKIKELKNCWRHKIPIVFDTKNKKITTSSFTGYVEFRDEEVFLVKTVCGRRIIATRDHPFFVKGKGWTELNHIKVKDKVAVYPHVKTFNEKIDHRLILSEKDISVALENIEISFGFKKLGETSDIRKLTTVAKTVVINFIKNCLKNEISYKKIVKKVEENYNLRISKSLISKMASSKDIHSRLDFVVRELKNKNLLPLTSDSPKLPILARILGHLFGDGSVIIKRRKEVYFPAIRLFFSGKKDDLEIIMKDLNELGFTTSKIEEKNTTSIVNERKVEGITTSFHADLLTLGILLITLGAPIGKKTRCILKMPKIVLNSSKHIKREFVSSYFGSELEILGLRKYKKGFDSPGFYLHRDKGFEEDGISFIKNICNILKEFNISTKLYTNEIFVNKKPKIHITCEIRCSDENILRFCEFIGYNYCKDREIRAKFAASYLTYKLWIKEKIEKEKNKIFHLKRSGVKPKEISKILGIPIKRVRYVYYESQKKYRPAVYIKSFDEWLKESTEGLCDGVIWDCVEEVSFIGKRTVADVGVKNFHNFIVNEFLTHNCETAVAYNEIEYEKVTDPAIYVKFKVIGEENTFLLCYTTTPWTIPANTGIMVNPDFKYTKVKVGNEVLIIAEELVEKTMKEAKIENYEVMETLLGKNLEDLKYEHPLAGLFPFHDKLEGAWKVVLSKEFVSLEEGTGLVHCAPGHGKEDYEVGLKNNLPAPSPVRMDGTFNEECGKFSGKYVKDADEEIIEELRERGMMFYEGKVVHDYPLCWRCDSPLLLVLIPQWFFRVTAIRKKLIQENMKINWIPEWAGKRFHNWLESLGDWPISRQRYWGIPLPIWECEKCGNVKVIGLRNELPRAPKDLHKPAIDEIYLRCKCGARMRRIPDVLDVWFDSGVAPWASLGFPKNKKIFEKLWPVKFVLEGPDQIRGWWNSLLITSLITFGRRPFDNVLFHGFVLDAHGIKMSKSRGNIVMAEDVVEKYGRDILRAYFLSSPCWDDYYFKWEDVEEIAKKFNVIRNTFNFVKTYVNKKGKPREFKIEDLWLLSKLNSLIESCTKHFKGYNIHRAANEIFSFTLEDLSRWYVKKIRDRVWLTYEGKDKQAAFFTLFTATETICRLLSPICPFLTEDVYQNFLKQMNGKYESIHMYQWPKSNKKFINKKLEANMEVARKIFEACSLARQKAGLKLRWPVKGVLIKLKDKRLKKAIDQTREVLCYFCNAKKVIAIEKIPSNNYLQVEFELGTLFLDKKLDEKLLEEALIRELIREIQQLRKNYKFKIEQSIFLTLNSDVETNKILEKNTDKIKEEVGAKKIIVGILEGKYQGILKFQNKKIEIKFNEA